MGVIRRTRPWRVMKRRKRPKMRLLLKTKKRKRKMMMRSLRLNQMKRKPTVLLRRKRKKGLAAVCVDGSRTVGHDKSAVGMLDMWTDVWALLSLSNADVRHRASAGVEFTRTASHTFSTVSRWKRWAIVGRHSQGSGDESEEQEKHLEAFSARQFSPCTLPH